MDTFLLYVALSLLVAGAFLFGRYYRNAVPSRRQRDEYYSQGLNYLLNERQDEALDVFLKLSRIDGHGALDIHMALGSLFRRRGELDQAIKLHQELLARPDLRADMRGQLILELARDYMQAGVFDRAEELFSSILQQPQRVQALTEMLTIYEREHEWQLAVRTAQRLTAIDGRRRNGAIAHYYCEQADIALQKAQWTETSEWIAQATATDRHCARAYMLSALLAEHSGEHDKMIQAYQDLAHLSPELLSEVVHPLLTALEKHAPERLQKYLDTLCSSPQDPWTVCVLADFLKRLAGFDEAERFVRRQLEAQPSLVLLSDLLSRPLPQNSQDTATARLQLGQQVLEKILQQRQRYMCLRCGYKSYRKLFWQCPSCCNWNTVKPFVGD